MPVVMKSATPDESLLGDSRNAAGPIEEAYGRLNQLKV
jgi:hypothetical protein